MNDFVNKNAKFVKFIKIPMFLWKKPENPRHFIVYLLNFTKENTHKNITVALLAR